MTISQNCKSPDQGSGGAEGRVPYECWSLAEADALDEAELVEGYWDGCAGEPEPGGNRSRAYQHGWWAGAVDGKHRSTRPWLMELARQTIARWREQRAA